MQRVLLKAVTFIKSCFILNLSIFQFVCTSHFEVSSKSDENVCSGDLLTFTCVAIGAGSTVWRGSAFMRCHGSNTKDISLRHTQFNSLDKPRGFCNNGAIVACAVGVDGDNYTSQLNVTVSPEMNNKTVECVHEYDLETNSTKNISFHRILVKIDDSEEMFFLRVKLANVSLGQLMFEWNLSANSCSSLHFLIFTNNCGVCPNETDLHYATCTNVLSAENHTCTFAVGAQTFSRRSNESVNYGDQINITLRGMNIISQTLNV